MFALALKFLLKFCTLKTDNNPGIDYKQAFLQCIKKNIYSSTVGKVGLVRVARLRLHPMHLNYEMRRLSELGPASFGFHSF